MTSISSSSRSSPTPPSSHRHKHGYIGNGHSAAHRAAGRAVGRRPVPRISEFFGIIISMYYNDHVPPHFHATYAEDRAEVGIDTLALIQGALPRRVLALVLEWASLRRAELQSNGEAARRGEPVSRIEPLE